tara:strand:+ start:5142 stop:5792 length:651 start_codon:yes stop_codon:yes gene_type:complete
MIAYGRPFIELLKDKQITITQHFILYSHAYGKLDMLDGYTNNIELIHVSNFDHLIELGYLEKNGTALAITFQGIEFIKGMVDSFADEKSENPFLGDDDLIERSLSLYADEFEDFIGLYPTKVTRTSGSISYLKEGRKAIKDLYIKIVQEKKVTPQQLHVALKFYVDKRKQTGNVAYLKTLKNWLKDEIWKDILLGLKKNKGKNNNNKGVNYGGKLI